MKIKLTPQFDEEKMTSSLTFFDENLFVSMKPTNQELAYLARQIDHYLRDATLYEKTYNNVGRTKKD